MERYVAVFAFALLILLVITRVMLLRNMGIAALQFGRTDKTEYLILPFALFYLYLLLGSTFRWPVVGSELFHRAGLSLMGVCLCALGLFFFAWALISFGKSFRVGLDEEHPGTLVTRGAFSISRNPIYVSFALVLTGIFLIIPNWIMLLYLFAAVLLFHRQVRKEERSLQLIYGEAYEAYCRQVKRYL